MYLSTPAPENLRAPGALSDPVQLLFAITGEPAQVPAATRDFFRLLFDPADHVLLRWVESWSEENPATGEARKRSWQARSGHILAGDLVSEHHPLDRRFYCWAGMLAAAELERASLYFGVCPRVRPEVVRDDFGTGSRVAYSWDQAWQVRTVRTLWADLDDCLPDAAVRRCDYAGLPRPSIVVSSGHGTHLYWILAQAYLVGDVPTPGPWVNEYARGRQVAEFGIDTATRGRFKDKPQVSPAGLRVEEVVAGLVHAVRGDPRTHDLARCLRVPGSLNRKGQRNGTEPVPCEVVGIDGGRRYALEDFERFRRRAATPAEARTRASRRVELPMAEPVEGGGAAWPAELEELAAAAAVAEDRSKAEFRLCCRAIELGISREAVWDRLRHQGKVGERGDAYLDRTWAAAVSRVGRQAHSWRIEPPGPAGPQAAPRITLRQARDQLYQHLTSELSRDPVPGRLNLIRVPPGVGKTWGVCRLLGEFGRKAVVLTLEKKLAATHAALIAENGGKALRMPVLRESPCPHPDAYEAMSRRGFRPSQSYPCKGCKIGPRRCSYLIQYASLPEADQLCGPAVFHTHQDFYTSHGNEGRPTVVLDESFVDLLLEPVVHPLDDWVAWGLLVRRWADQADAAGHPDVAPLLRLVEWLEAAAAGFLGRKDGEGDPLKFELHELPEGRRAAGVEKAEALDGWLHKNATRDGHKRVPNLYGPCLYLLSVPDAHVFLERISRGEDEEDAVVVRFRRRNALPEDREVFLLDATADPALVRAVLPGWDVRVWDCPPVEQRGRVVQVMDRDVSRGRIRREVERHQPHNPAWLVQLVDAVLERGGPMPVVTFKKVTTDPAPEMDLLSLLKYRNRITDRYNYPCRGHTFPDRAMLVIGTPYPNELAYWELAFAIWGRDRLPASRYTRRYREAGGWSVGNMGYEEPHLRLLRDHFVSAELAQAVGRLRPLENDCKVVVVTNAPVPVWEVERALSAELFDLARPLRQDAADRYGEYARAAAEIAAGGRKPTNAAVCRALGLSERTGRRYFSRLKSEQAKAAHKDAGGYERYSAEVLRLLDAGLAVGNADVSRSLGIPERTGRRYMDRFRDEHQDDLEVVGRKVRRRPAAAVVEAA